MKALKNISLFFIYPMATLCLGLYAGAACQSFFYPGKADVQEERTEESRQPEKASAGEAAGSEGAAVPVSVKEEKLNADTEYVLREVDTRKETSVETVWKLPQKYIGMNREQFVEAMDQYELSPPLQELERGFVGLEVLDFSTKKVTVEMDYIYVEPTKSFLLRVEDHFVVVYCDDGETVYMNTSLILEDLPDNIQQDIIQGMYVEDEEALYNFLETYSS